MANGLNRNFEYGEIAASLDGDATPYLAFADSTGFGARIAEERLTVSGTALRFALVDHRGVDFAVPFDITVTPAERADLSLGIVLACIQAAAVMGDLVGSVTEREFLEAQASIGEEPTRGGNLRRGLIACRDATSAAFGSDYEEFMALGAGPALAAELGGGEAPKP